MFGGLRDNSLLHVRVAETLVDKHESILETLPTDMHSAARVHAVASCVTRLYAIYEHFVETLISDYLDAVSEIIPYASLPDVLKNEYRIGISYILGRLESERYCHLTNENIILWYHEAISGSPKYHFVTEALTRHDSNLRLNVVDKLAAKADLKNLKDWLARCTHIASLYEQNDRIIELLESELNKFVQLRNDAAHGALQELEGRDNLRRYCQLIHSLITAISEYFSKALLESRIAKGKSKTIGTVTETFKKHNVFIVKLKEGSSLEKGQKIHLHGLHYYAQQTIESLQINGNDSNQITAQFPNFEVGIKCSFLPKKNADLVVDT